MSAAILPPAPPLFSTTTDWPQTSCRRLLMRRAVISVEPPGANGTTTRTGLTGQSAPEARDDRMDGAATVAAAIATKRRRFNMGALLNWPGCLGSCCFRQSVKAGFAKINSGGGEAAD